MKFFKNFQSVIYVVPLHTRNMHPVHIPLPRQIQQHLNRPMPCPGDKFTDWWSETTTVSNYSKKAWMWFYTYLVTDRKQHLATSQVAQQLDAAWVWHFQFMLHTWARWDSSSVLWSWPVSNSVWKHKLIDLSLSYISLLLDQPSGEGPGPFW